jgi:hypothetical protein
MLLGRILNRCCFLFLFYREACVRIISTALLTATFLGSTISLGWSPEPATNVAPRYGSSSATPAAVFRATKPKESKDMSPGMRASVWQWEWKKGNIKTPEERRNWIATGDKNKAPPPPPPKMAQKPVDPTKPPGVPQSAWDKYKAAHPNQTYPTYRQNNPAMDRLQGM